MHCEISMLLLKPFSLAHPCYVEIIWGPVGGLVIEDVGVRDKAPLEIPSRSAIILCRGLGSCSTADISIYICHVCIPEKQKENETQRERKEGTCWC